MSGAVDHSWCAAGLAGGAVAGVVLGRRWRKARAGAERARRARRKRRHTGPRARRRPTMRTWPGERPATWRRPGGDEPPG